LARIWEIVLLVLLVIGGIAMGWISPSEAAAIGAAGALATAALRRRLGVAMLKEAMAETLKTSGMLMLIIIGALTMAIFVGVTGLADAAGEAVSSMGLGPLGTLFLVAFILLVLGSVLDGLALMLLTTPILLPIVTETGMTAIWFGIFITRAMEIGFVHPPLGMNLYVIQGVSGSVPIGRIFKGVTPFLVSDFVHLALLILFPALVYWLPSVVGP
jgi:tripartite ATP-independent transporter DctM subunit